MNNNFYKNEFINKYCGLLILLAAIIVGLMGFERYGNTWDETQQRKTAQVNYEYIFSGDQGLMTWVDRDYGVAFEMPLIFIEKVFNLEDSYHVYLMRHLVTHLFFLLSCFVFFLLIDYLYKSKLLAVIGFLLLLLHPRLYAHSFFNSKDIPFLSMFIISIYFTVKALDKKSIASFVLLGISIGLLINFRIMGVMLPVFILLWLAVDAFCEKRYLFHLKLTAILVLTSCITLYASWPFLWTNPIEHFMFAFRNMSQFRASLFVLLNGEFVNSQYLPFTYAPTWMTITTPIIHVILGLLGIVLISIKLWRQPPSFITDIENRRALLFLACFLAPIGAVVVLNSVLYDGWRQLYFVYAPFGLLAIYALFLLRKHQKTFAITLFLLALTFLNSTFFMVKNHPFQQVYFNEAFAFTPPEYLKDNYEMDYWGIGFKQALEYLLEIDDSSTIDVYLNWVKAESYAETFPPQLRKRINFVPKEEATYFVTNYRFHPQEYDEIKDKKIHAIKVDGNTINAIFKLK